MSELRCLHDPTWGAWLDEAERLGLVTPAGRRVALAHSLAMASALERALPELGEPEARLRETGELRKVTSLPPLAKVVDLGSGPGLPGLVVAAALPGVEVLLVEASTRRADFLALWTAALGLGGRVEVWNGRAEVLGREPKARERAAAVTARGFGPPSVVAECAAPLLRLGGVLVVADPPVEPGEGSTAPLLWDENRWPPEALAELGLEPLERRTTPFSLSLLRKARATPERYPRRAGVPAKRPLFGRARS